MQPTTAPARVALLALAGALVGASLTLPTATTFAQTTPLPPDGFETWIASRPAPVPLEQRGTRDDPDGDGITNFLEFALGRDPIVADSAPVLTIESDGALQTLRYRRARPELDYRVETCTDLASGSWTTEGVIQQHGVQGDTITAAFVVGSETTRRFFRLRVAGPVADIERIVDNATTDRMYLSGEWTTHTGAATGQIGPDFLHDGDSGKGAKRLRFIPDLPEAGTYRVYVRWPHATDLQPASNARVIVAWAGGANQTLVDQRQGAGEWRSVGAFPFLAGSTGYVEFDNSASDGHVLADAVRFVREEKLWTPEDFGDRLWTYWTADSLPDGPVAEWRDSRRGVVASQPDPALQPVKQNGEVFFASGHRRLLFPKDTAAHTTHRNVMILFRADVTGTASSGQPIFSVNGVEGSNFNRQPYVSITPNTRSLSVTWRTGGGNNSVSGLPIPNDKALWNALVSRRGQFFHHASLNGRRADGAYGEEAVPMADWGLIRNNSNTVTGSSGFIGSHTSAAERAIDTIIVLQGDATQADADLLSGWALWKKGQPHLLPDEHPYRHSPPRVPTPHYQFVESTPEQYLASRNYIRGAAGRAFRGTPVDLTGWQLVWADEFDRHSVTHEATGKGKWFSPVHPHPTGAARAIYAGTSSSDPTLGTPVHGSNHAENPPTYLHDPAAGTMTIVMQKNSAGRWVSGAFCSVNASGFGETFRYPYVEARMRTGLSSTGNRHGSWPAVWLESINMLKNRAESYAEYDIYEGYSPDPRGHHYAYHNHDAAFLQPGRLAADRYTSNYLNVRDNWHESVNLFDDRFHVYAAMITPEWVINYFDGREVGRFPTPPEMDQEFFIILDLALMREEAHLADGAYKLEIDYVRVYQNPEYPGSRATATPAP